VEGNRRFADEPEPSWYSGQGQYTTPGQSPYDSGVHERPSGAFRLPEQRESEYAAPSPYVTPDPVDSTGSHARTEAVAAAQDNVRIPVRGPEYPTIRPTGATSLADAPPATTYGGGSSAPVSSTPAQNGGAVAAYNEPTSVVPPVSRFAPEPKPADSVYRTRRPVSAIVIAIVTFVLLVPAVLLLVRATFVDDPTARGIVPAVLLTLGLPLTGVGLYALAGGGPAGRDVWLRPPVAYLPVGLLLLLAAGLAVA
jgi:hypothetical protein